MLAVVSTIIKFFSGLDLSFLSGLIPGVLSFLQKYWQYVLIVLLVLSNLFTYHEWQTTSSDLKIEKAAHAADVKAFKDAQAEADKKALAEKQQLIAESKVQANEADANYTDLYNKYHANLLRFEQANKGSTDGPAAGQHGDPAQNTDGPGTSPVVSEPTQITITSTDANICAINTARLQAAHDWAEQLVEKSKDANPQN